MPDGTPLQAVATALNVEPLYARSSPTQLRVALPSGTTEQGAETIADNLAAARNALNISRDEMGVGIRPYNDGRATRYELVILTENLSATSIQRLQNLPPNNPLRAAIPAGAQRQPQQSSALNLSHSDAVAALGNIGNTALNTAMAAVRNVTGVTLSESSPVGTAVASLGTGAAQTPTVQGDKGTAVGQSQIS